ncbi:hypothetical protein [Acrocarpospora sp. B8E8]|uniref:hypothetical protein n=1 Tax=Acrocarpospora sp. B8E8 TaxID=3153572 RepID=UPI00325D5F35
MLLICLYGLAGSGKSTAAAHLTAVLTERGYRVETLKIAAPLYELQGHIYRRADAEIGAFEHDNELLRTLATQIRRINPGFLPGDFLRRVWASSADIVVNDDMRDADPDYYALREAGFYFVRITCADAVRLQRMNARADRTIVADSDAT